MKSSNFRRMYIDFFKSKAHAEISGKSLIPENDPTVLFTTAGMHPLVPYLMGEEHPAGKRLVNVQKCIRTGDIESVGDATHLTFFEMLGNWSLRDYFRKESLKWSYEFLTSSDYLSLQPERIWVTIFKGDENAPFDKESRKVWLELGIAPQHIIPLPAEHNWWGPPGKTGPCGPDSEIFYDTGQPFCGPDCRPGCPCSKFLEIWNNVFIQYRKESDGTFRELKQPCVDTGMGLERTCTMLSRKKNVYETELFTEIIKAIENIAGIPYLSQVISFRIIADHVKTATMILGDQHSISPSNLGRGYILRRLIRRAIRYGMKIGINRAFLGEVALAVISTYAGIYDELQGRKDFILGELALEEKLFRKSLVQGQKEFDKIVAGMRLRNENRMDGKVIFHLYDTYGFPREITRELCSEAGIEVDDAAFEEALRRHQQTSRKGAEKTFRGGLADDSVMSTRYHTATHLLHEALRRILGSHVVQKGSNITPERLRFDFAHPRPMTGEEKKQVEEMVNSKILENLPVDFSTMTLEEARALNARALFEGKYDEQVKVYRIGDFSIEVCGGPHVGQLSGLGRFVITREQSSSRGVRRIRAKLV